MDVIIEIIAALINTLWDALIALSNAGFFKISLTVISVLVIGLLIAYFFPIETESFEIIETIFKIIGQPDIKETTICRDIYKFQQDMKDDISKIQKKALSIVFIKPLNNKNAPRYEAYMQKISMENISDDFYAYLFEFLQMRFTNWYINMSRFGEKNEDIYRQSVLAMPELQAAYEELSVIFSDDGSHITPELEQKIRDRMYIICATLDTASAPAFRLANEEADKIAAEVKLQEDLRQAEVAAKQKAYEKEIGQPFERLEALNKLSSDAEIEQLSYFYGKGEENIHEKCRKTCSK